MQITFEVPAELDGKISVLMQNLNVTQSALMRAALEYFVNMYNPPPVLSPYERAKDLIGVIESNIPDLGSNHEEHLANQLNCYSVFSLNVEDFSIYRGKSNKAFDIFPQ